jgi:hyperosmotically inducible periplasmic protein
MRKALSSVSQLSVIFVLLSSLGFVRAQDSTATQPPADNTATNKRDRNQSEPTADQQKNNKSDRELARQIRRALVKDKSLSTNAHNVKVIAKDGTVILKGPVQSDQEKQAVEAKAAEVAGSSANIHSEIDVTGKQASNKPSAGKPSPNHR